MLKLTITDIEIKNLGNIFNQFYPYQMIFPCAAYCPTPATVPYATPNVVCIIDVSSDVTKKAFVILKQKKKTKIGGIGAKTGQKMQKRKNIILGGIFRGGKTTFFFQKW